MTCTVESLSKARRSAGISLVESLVALVVLSIGMLGIAALYVESLRSGRTALLRTQAITLAGDMADRVRANRGAEGAYEDTVTSAQTDEECEQAGAGCTMEELAHHDKAVWLGAIEAALPGGAGTIDVDDTTTPATYTIQITWTEAGQEEPLSYQVRIQA